MISRSDDTDDLMGDFPLFVFRCQCMVYWTNVTVIDNLHAFQNL